MLKVFIDPGHVGSDVGAVGHGDNYEKDINFEISNRLHDKLKEYVDVKLSRSINKYLHMNINSDLKNRTDMANSYEADIFISIHCNAAGDKSANGTETFCYELGGKSEKLAKAIQSKLIKTTGLRDRGVKAKNLAVLRLTKMPAVLVELAFISNPTEEKLLVDHVWQDKVAQAIADGVKEYLGIVDVEKKIDNWKLDIINEAWRNRLISEKHHPDETAAKWFVLAVANKLYKEIKNEK